MHVLQTTLLPAPGKPSALYLLLKTTGSAGVLRLPTHADRLDIELQPKDVLSTDTFFASFFTSHWKAYTDIDTLAVVVGFRGFGKFRVFEVTATGTEMLCEYELRSVEVRRHLIAFRPSGLDCLLPDGQTASRVFVEFEATTNCLVQSIEFVTEDAPRNDIALSIGISTFNEARSQIAALLPAVLRLAEAAETIRSVHVVNHGPAFTDTDLVTALHGPKVRLAVPAADNAPGGLAQTIEAARNAGDGSTHHLVLADDISLDERFILRAIQFLRYANRPVMLGGAALDARSPTRLRAAGALINANGQFWFPGENLDLTAGHPLGQFETTARAEYCPWWFCVLPLDKDTTTALPQRPFLRGDDYAFGLSQNRKGVANLNLPGIGVWRKSALALPASVDHSEFDLANRFYPLRTVPSAVDAAQAAPAQKLHMLQATMFPADDLAELMYLRVTPPRRRGGLVPRETQSGKLAICLEPKSFMSTDTFFGSFYRAYWQEYTKVRDISIAVELSGAAKIRVFEDAGRGIMFLNEEHVDSITPQRYLIDILPSDLTLLHGELEPRPSRLFVEVEAETATEVYAIDFLSKEAPLQRTTLSIGLCTFNQEAYLARTLASVARLAKNNDAIRAVHVVNQGPPFKSKAIQSLLKEPKIAAVEQRNLGGCGGFTRSLVEEFAAPVPATYHLMMDDDIVLDERMILRSMRFLDYSAKEVSIGAGMLDSLRPSISHEIGAFLWPDLSFTSYCRDVDLSDAGNLWQFNTPVKTNYNAWWFCILPVERARKLALPAPIFIRGDDLEYGTRLGRDGVPTISLPGIGVWHEPFHSKTSYWSDYYNLRNRLIFAGIYSDHYQQLPLTTVMGYITAAILTHNYQSAEEQMKSVRDFLLGPKKLFAKDTEEIHKEVMALVKRDIPEKLDATWKLRPLAKGAPRPPSMRAKIRDSLKAMMQTGFGQHDRGGNEIIMDVLAHPGNTGGKRYVLTNGLRSYHLRFTPRRGRMWSLMMRAAWLAVRYRSQKAAVGADWAAHIATYRDPAWWDKYFAPPGAAPQQAAPTAPKSVAKPAVTSAAAPVTAANVAPAPEKLKEKT